MDRAAFMKISLVMSYFRRPELLRVGLSSILRYKPTFDMEIIVVNDGIEDECQRVCESFSQQLNIRYIFSGQRNLDGVMKSRVSGFALNVGIKQSTGDIIILSCPEIYHLGGTLQLIVDRLIQQPKSMAIPRWLYFDLTQQVTNQLKNLSNEQLKTVDIDTKLLAGGQGDEAWCGHRIMPYCMAIYKNEIVEIGGYNEKMIGYAADDNSFCERLKRNGLNYSEVDTKIVHLWHGGTGDGKCHYENPAWVLNYNILEDERKNNITKVNIGREWGKVG